MTRPARIGTLALCLAAGAAAAQDSRVCAAAAAQAARETGVPPALLSAILAAETGGGPGGAGGWPWTLNAAGRGEYLPTAAAARRRLAELAAAGVASIDVGCFQINLRWHGAAYRDPAALLDPPTNARHAAAYLRQLHAETGAWRPAAARYHSRDPARAEGYVRRLETLHAAAGPGAAPAAAPEPPATPAAQGAIVPLARRLPPLLRGPAGRLVGGGA
jgi:hypothetical protein